MRKQVRSPETVLMRELFPALPWFMWLIAPLRMHAIGARRRILLRTWLVADVAEWLQLTGRPLMLSIAAQRAWWTWRSQREGLGLPPAAIKFLTACRDPWVLVEPARYRELRQGANSLWLMHAGHETLHRASMQTWWECHRESIIAIDWLGVDEYQLSKEFIVRVIWGPKSESLHQRATQVHAGQEVAT